LTLFELYVEYDLDSMLYTRIGLYTEI